MSAGNDTRYARLIVVGEADPVIRVGRDKRRVDRRVHVVCDCGTVTTVFLKHLRSGASQSCGCLSRERASERRGAANPMTTHGLTRTPTYETWRSMLGRCLNLNAPSARHYSGRGITVCERWRTFENFLADMGVRPYGRTLDRIDNDGNYEPGNCRWATPKEQRANQRPRSLVR